METTVWKHSKGNKTVPEKVLTTRTEDGHNRIPKQALQYRTKGRRNIGRPKKRWRDQLHFEDQGKVNTPNPSWTWWWWWRWWWTTVCAISIQLTNSQPNFSKPIVKITLPSVPEYLKRIIPVRFINQLLSLISPIVVTYLAPHIALIWSAKQFGEYHVVPSLLPNTTSPLFLHVFSRQFILKCRQLRCLLPT